jgi:hypothetical protein
MVKRFLTIRKLILAALLSVWATSLAFADSDSFDFSTARKTHWAYQSLVEPSIPTVANAPVGSSDIDQFILAALDRTGLHLAPPADKRTFIRRATFDLTGLPPTYDEVQEFIHDTSQEAFAKVIDRLLESPRYGERWGRHWLDLARYADTHGGGAVGAVFFPFSYPYRDYVIAAMNKDLPYDRFLLEQIAADQLPRGKDSDTLAALGFLTVGRQFRNYHDTIDDLIDVVTRGLMGLTVTCARCHNHKYDAIPTEDYYSLYAVFNAIEKPDELPLVGDPPETREYREYQHELKQLKTIHDNARRDHKEIMQRRLRMQVGLYLRELAKGTPQQDLSIIFLSYRTEDVRPPVLNLWREYLAEQTSVDDPVFGPWQQMSKFTKTQFVKNSAELVATMHAENGAEGNDPDKYNSATATPPRWNPRVLDALAANPLTSMLDVADAYGDLFAAIEKEWLEGMITTTLEAVPGTPPVSDRNPMHLFLNSPVNRQLRYHLHAPGTPTCMSDKSLANLFNRTYRDRVLGYANAVQQLHLNSPASPPRAMALLEKEAPETQHVFRRGSPIDRGKVVSPRFPAVLAKNKNERKTFADGIRRLELAKAIVDPDNPLTSRVVVNWIWQHHFGRGLIRTPDDFGVRGEPPTHPQLLDYLAKTFMRDGWSMKQLHRRIMLSFAYRQSSSLAESHPQVDFENRLLWRMPPKRLDLEAMRDAMLAVAGVLDVTMGGRPIDLFAEPAIARRTVYGFFNRDVIPSLFSTFDMSDPSACTLQRPDTTVPQQALFALNSNFVIEQARHLARATVVEEDGDETSRIRRLYQRVYARDPHPEEVAIALQYIETKSANVNANVNIDVWVRYAHVLLAANEFVFID